jgi:hypothetical protein
MSFVTNDIALLVVSLAIVLLVGAVALVHVASRRASRVLGDVASGQAPLQSFRGGLRWPLPAGLGATNTPPVLVGLQLFEWGLRIDARWSWLKPFVPSWFARYDEIWAAELVRRGPSLSKRRSEGVRFRGHLSGAPLIFWTSSSGSLLELLEQRGVAVVRAATTARVWTNE